MILASEIVVKCYISKMADQTDNLVLEILRKMQGYMAALKNDNREIKAQLIDVRSMLVTMKSDALRQERAMAGVQVGSGSRQTRLDLSDA